jgi:hypothetical protein
LPGDQALQARVLGGMGAKMEEPDFLLFASDATLAGLAGAGFMILAVVATFAEWRRSRRRNIDRVGWVPWTAVFLASFLLANVLLLLAVKGWLAG